MTTTIFERCGGFATVRGIVSSFYDRMLESPRLEPYFAHVDMRRLIDHQTQFVSAMMGGPVSFTNDHLHRVHARLKIARDEFLEMADLLTETLEDFDLPDEDVAHVRREILKREMYIVTRRD